MLLKGLTLRNDGGKNHWGQEPCGQWGQVPGTINLRKESYASFSVLQESLDEKKAIVPIELAQIGNGEIVSFEMTQIDNESLRCQVPVPWHTEGVDGENHLSTFEE